MRDRLIELIEEWYKDVPCDCLADHLLSNGVIVPPCKTGDTLYYLEGSRICTGTAKFYSVNTSLNWYAVHCETKYSLVGFEKFGFWMFGKTVFLTREEAEQALKGGEEE